MAKSGTFRTYEDQGNSYIFSSVKFRAAVDTVLGSRIVDKDENKKLDYIFDEIARNVSTSTSAVKNWYYGYNGPGDDGIIKRIAKYLKTPIEDLTENTEAFERTIVEDFEPTGHDETSIVRGMFKLFIDYIYMFVGTYYESNAMLTFEDEYGENDKYIHGLYECLDKSALYLKQDTYMNLRKTITELRYITEPHEKDWFPESWVDVNPYLGSDDFNLLRKGILSSSHGVWNTKLLDDPKKVMHMFLEDLPDIERHAKENAELYMYNGYSIEQIIEANRDDLDYNIFELIVRETTMTLSMVMRRRFEDVL